MVGYMVFLIFWSLLTGLQFWSGGVFSSFLDGRIGYVFFILLVVLLITTLSSSPKAFPPQNIRIGFAYLITLLLVYILHILATGVFDNNLIIWALQGFVLISLRDDLKIRCFEIYIQLLGILLLFAIIEYILFVLTGFGVVTAANVQRGDSAQFFTQLVFNFIQKNFDFPRFQFLTEEPGLLGTACGFAIFALRQLPKYRLQYFIFIFAGLITFSLAFYVIFILHILTSNVRAKYTILILIAGVLLYYLLKDYIDYLLFYRIGDRTVDEIDNRTSEELRFALSRSYEIGEFWLGHGDLKNIGGGNAGGLVWLWIYGFWGVAMIFIVDTWYYFKMVKRHHSYLWHSFIFFVVFWLSFYQRQNITFPDYLIVYLTIPLLNSKMLQRELKLSEGKASFTIF